MKGGNIFHFSKTTPRQLHTCSITVYKNTVINIIIIIISAGGINFRAPGKKILCFFFKQDNNLLLFLELKGCSCAEPFNLLSSLLLIPVLISPLLLVIFRREWYLLFQNYNFKIINLFSSFLWKRIYQSKIRIWLWIMFVCMVSFDLHVFVLGWKLRWCS